MIGFEHGCSGIGSDRAVTYSTTIGHLTDKLALGQKHNDGW